MKSHFVAVAALFLLFAFACVVPTWAQSTCPTGFRDVQIVNACDDELWLGQQVASVGAAPGSGQSAQQCLTNKDCSSYPNSYCNQGVMCQSNSDCNNFQLTNGCSTDNDCAAVLPGSTCLPGGAPQLCSGVCNSKTDNRCAVWNPSQDGNTTVGPNYCFANSQRTLVGSAYECLGGLCQYFEYYPGENTACTQSSQCSAGQTCNTLVGLCQYRLPCEATDSTNPNQVSCPSGYTCTNNTRNGQVPLCNLSSCSPCPSGWLCNNGCQLDPALIDYKAGAKQDLCMPGTAGTVISPLTTVNQNTVLWARAGCPNFESCGPVGAKCSASSDCCSSLCQGSVCQNSNLGACLSGDCGGNAICSGGGASRGFTKVEFNLQAPYQQNQNPTDFYDVSLVDGFNVAAAFKPASGTSLPAANQCNSNADCQTSTGQTCVIQNGVGTCTCTAGEPHDCPSPYLCDAKPGKSGMCSIDPYSCGTPGRSGARTTARGTPSWPAVAIEGCDWNLTQSKCPAELQMWQPILNSGNEVTCTQQSDCSAFPGSSCEYAPDRLAGPPGVQLFCSTYVGCMNPNNVCSNSPVYGSTGPYVNLGCTNNQIALHNIQCSSNADCPAMQGGGNLACSSGKCVNPTCTGNSQCPVGLLCGSQSCGVSGSCVDPVTCTDAAPYSDLYGTTGYSPYTCYSGAPTAYPQQCQGCLLWSDFGALGSFPGNPLPMAQAVCPASSAGNATNQNFFAAANPNGQSYSAYASIYKSACPSAYSAQFDDHTSTFQCIQPPNYTLTFCPQNAGKGLPAASKQKP
jgi:hypothetical protein